MSQIQPLIQSNFGFINQKKMNPIKAKHKQTTIVRSKYAMTK